MELPENVKAAWGQIDPVTAAYTIDNVMVGIWFLSSHEAVETGVVNEPVVIKGALVAGHPGAVYQLVNQLESMGVKCFYAHTQRESVEKQINGEVIKTSAFKHRGFFSMVNNLGMEEFFHSEDCIAE